ncbi:MAG: hypothetical protein KJ587_02300 [Alphaproteobacteria bacterium]|nr:hypothetical protein [Alphaproteobacteria bacterium]
MTARSILTVGVSGHRPNRMHIGEAAVARRLWLVLAALRSGARGAKRVAMSALAEGSDRLFAEAALDLGYELRALLPFPSADYETTFGDQATPPHYRALLALAATVTELPGTLADSKAGYEAVGHATVAASDILVAIWDGKGAAGRGGTPEIIDHAVRAAKPVIWIDAARNRLPLLIAAPTAQGARDVPLATLAARAKPLTRRRIARLAAGESGEH